MYAGRGMLTHGVIVDLVLQVVEFALMTALLSHWTACIWGLLPQLQGPGHPNWMDKYIDNSKFYEAGSNVVVSVSVSGSGRESTVCVYSNRCQAIANGNIRHGNKQRRHHALL